MTRTPRNAAQTPATPPKPRRQGTEAPRITERALQHQIVDWLERVAQCTVIQTGQWKHASVCPSCGQRFYARSGWGNSRGCPDLLAGHPSLGHRLIGLELKVVGGAVKPQQQELVDRGITYLVHSIEEVMDVLIHEGVPVPVGSW